MAAIVWANVNAPALVVPSLAGGGGPARVIVNVQPPTIYLHRKRDGSLAAAGSVHGTSRDATS